MEPQDISPATSFVTLDPDTYMRLQNANISDKGKNKKGKEKKVCKQKEIDSSDDDDVPNDTKKDKNKPETIHFITNSGDIYELQLCFDPRKSMYESKYDVKLHMVNERTFFKYLFTSLHIGAIATFLISFYTSVDRYKMLIIGFIWLSAFSVLFLGFYTYYYRRRLMQQGEFYISGILHVHGPSIVLFVLCTTFLLIIIYSISTNQIPSKHHTSVAPPATIYQPT